MRMPLRTRVVLLVAAFNVLFFSAGLAWSVSRFRDERAARSRLEETIVRESLATLLLAVRGDRVKELLEFPDWGRYDDAMIVQLQEFEPRFGIIPAVRAVTKTGQARVIPPGLAVPLATPPPRTPPSVPWPASFLGWPTPGPDARLPWPRLRRPGRVWGAAFLRGPLLLPEQVVAAFARAQVVGLPLRSPAGLDPYLESVLVEARDRAGPRAVEGGVVVPLRTPEGELYGAAYSSLFDWMRLPFDPVHWRERLIFVGRPEFGFGPILTASGLYLNPLGAAHRPPDFDDDGVLADIRSAVEAERAIENERGLAIPLRLASGELWGGVWLDPRAAELVWPVLRELLPAFVISTLLLTGVTFFGMQRLVLDPVRRLAGGARRLAVGELSTRIPESPGRDELSELVRSFNAMAGQVEGFNTRLALEVEHATKAARDAEAAAMTQRRLAATGELAAGIAHEINNPLGGLINALEVLRRADVDPEKRARYLDLVEGGLERIRETVGQLLRLAPREMRVAAVSLADPIGDALGLVRHRAEKQGTRIRLAGVGGVRPVEDVDALEPWRRLPPVRGQANELGQAVLNLLVNALDALEGRTGAGLEVGLERAGDELRLWIADEGPGMDPELLPRAADLFFTTKDAGRGTGLGLAIVHNVVSTHGGSVRWSNVPTGGFRVDVALPVEDAA